MPIYLDEDMQGVCEVCGSKAKTRCADCKATFFCSRVCQRALRDNHKKECKIEAAIARCLDANTAKSHILESRNRRPPDGATCLICLEGAGDSEETLLYQGCACRGTAGYAHVRCVFEHALRRDVCQFYLCITCNDTAWQLVVHSRESFSLPKVALLTRPILSLLIGPSSLTLGVGTQRFSGEFLFRLFAACWRQFRRIDALNPTTTEEQQQWWFQSYNLVANELYVCDCIEESLILRRDALAVARTLRGPDSREVIDQLPGLADCLIFSGKASEARDLLAPHAMAWRSAKNTSDRNAGLNLCRVFATSLGILGDFARAEVLLKLIIENIAQHPGDQETDSMGDNSKLVLIGILHNGRRKDKEALDVANDLLEKLTRTLGPEHPRVLQLRHYRDEILTKLECPPQK